MIPRDEDREMLPLREVEPAAYADAIDEGAKRVLEAVAEVAADPNLDLVGYEIPNVGTVTGTAPWSEGQYVLVQAHTGAFTTRPAGLVRASRS